MDERERERVCVSRERVAREAGGREEGGKTHKKSNPHPQTTTKQKTHALGKSVIRASPAGSANTPLPTHALMRLNVAATIADDFLFFCCSGEEELS